MAFCRVLGISRAILYALTTLSLRFHGAGNACAALSRRLHCAAGMLKMQCRDFNLPFRSFGQGPVEFEKIAFVPSKFYYIYSVKMNKISFIYLCLNKQNVKNFCYE